MADRLSPLPSDVAERYKDAFTSPRFERAPSHEIDPHRRIVVVGMGTINSLGRNVNETWKSVLNGAHGISPLEGDGFDHNKVTVAGQIKDFDPREVFREIIVDFKHRKTLLKQAERATQFAALAAHEALTQARVLGADGKIDPTVIDPFDVSAVIATGVGGAHYIAKTDRKLWTPPDHEADVEDIFKSLPEQVASVPSRIFNIQGGAHAPIAACASGNYGISGGADNIMLGRSKIAVVGGTDACITPAVLAQFEKLGALSRTTDPNRASIPFDEDRTGFVMSEGAGVLVIEERDHALARGVPIIAELVGYAEASDAEHPTDPNGIGAARAMRLSLRNRKGHEGMIYVAAHATSTGTGDPQELLATKAALEGKHIAGVSAPKSMLGHGMGSAGGTEAVIGIKALTEQVLPPTVGLRKPVPEGEGLNLVPIEAQVAEIDTVINNAFGFGGLNNSNVWIRHE